jgi:hypothetical protein
MGRFDKPWEDPKNPIVAARPSAKYPGGTVYFFADGSRTEVYGGGASYRANSPGIDVPRPRDPSGRALDSDEDYHARIAPLMKHYGAIGYTESAGGTDHPDPRKATGQLVFGNADAAKAGYAKLLDDRYEKLLSKRKTGEAPPSVKEVLGASNAEENPSYPGLADGVFKSRSDGFGDQTDLLKKPYALLTPEEKQAVVNKGLRVEGYDNPHGATLDRHPPDPSVTAPPLPWQKASVQPGPGEADPQWATGGPEPNPPESTTGTPSLRAALEQRAADLGVGYGEYMPTDALLAEIHSREAAAAGPAEADGVADRIDQEINGIGLPLVAQPELGNPPPLGLGAPTRADLDQRAAGLGLSFAPAVPDDRVLAAVHSQESAAAPPAAADALADRMEREIDGTLSAANIPWTGGDDAMDMGEGQA